MEKEEILEKVKDMLGNRYPDLKLNDQAYNNFADAVCDLLTKLSADLDKSWGEIADEVRADLRAEIREEMEEELRQSKRNLDSPATHISFRELQDYLSLLKEHRELIENPAATKKDFTLQLINIKQQELALSEKLLNSRYW